MTASAEELRLMLYEGAIKFCRQGIESIAEKQTEAAYNSLMRAQKIVLELSSSLNHQLDPDLCSKLSALYTYIYRLLVDANMKHERTPIDEAIKLLEYEKETWQMLMKKAGETQGAGGPASVAGAQQTAISSLTVNG